LLGDSDASGYSVFYDEFEQAELWGRDLSVALGSVYSREARYCLIILSADYVAKPWTNLERQNVISEFIQRRSDYILVLKVDDTDLPGFPSIIGYVALDRSGEDGVYKLLLQKLGRSNHANMLSHLDHTDTKLAQQILKRVFGGPFIPGWILKLTFEQCTLLLARLSERRNGLPLVSPTSRSNSPAAR
jgi:hypothetical protein